MHDQGTIVLKNAEQQQPLKNSDMRKDTRNKFDGKRHWKWGDIKLRKIGESKHQNEMGMNPDSCLGAWFEKEPGKGGTTLDQTKHSWFSTDDPKRKRIKKIIRRDEDLPPREMLDYPLSLRSLPPRKFREKILKESSKRRKEMSKGEQDYVTTSTDYLDKKIGHTMSKRGQLEVNHHSFSLYSLSQIIKTRTTNRTNYIRYDIKSSVRKKK